MSLVWLILAGKEYSKADSRYAGRDPTVVVVEGITAVLAGPGCLLAVYALSCQSCYDLSVVVLVYQLARTFNPL